MKYEINVKGMRCQHCVKSVEKEVSAIAGVTSCNVNLQTGVVTVETNNENVSVDNIKSTICDLGFEVL